jgi:hypothetical protein
MTEKPKLKLPPGCKWIDTTKEHVGSVFTMIPAEMRDGVLFPGLVQEFKIEDAPKADDDGRAQTDRKPRKERE